MWTLLLARVALVLSRLDTLASVCGGLIESGSLRLLWLMLRPLKSSFLGARFWFSP